MTGEVIAALAEVAVETEAQQDAIAEEVEELTEAVEEITETEETKWLTIFSKLEVMQAQLTAAHLKLEAMEALQVSTLAVAETAAITAEATAEKLLPLPEPAPLDAIEASSLTSPSTPQPVLEESMTAPQAQPPVEVIAESEAPAPEPARENRRRYRLV